MTRSNSPILLCVDAPSDVQARLDVCVPSTVQVLSCSTLGEARKIVERTTPSALVISLMLGDLGARLVHELRQRDQSLGVVLVVPRAFSIAAMRPWGPVELVKRPVDDNLLVASLQKALGIEFSASVEQRRLLRPQRAATGSMGQMARSGANPTRKEQPSQAVSRVAPRTPSLPRALARKGPDKVLLSRVDRAVRRALDSGRQQGALPLSQQTTELIEAAGGEVRTMMSMMGVLDVTPFAALLYKIFANRMTGMLFVERSGAERTLFFCKGEPVYALSNASSESLGSVMLDLGMIQVRELSEVLDSKPPDELLGQCLLRRGLVTLDQLMQALDQQVQQRFLSCFGFESGMYVFGPDSSWVDELPHFAHNPIELIHIGVQRFVAPNVLASHLQDHLQHYVVRTEKFEQFRPHFPAEDETLKLLNGTRTVEALTRDAPMDVMALLRLVWALHQSDMVDFSATPNARPSRPSRKPPLPEPSSPSLPLARKTAEEDIGSAIGELYSRMGLDYWSLLGVAPDADEDALRRAFQELLGRIPPERIKLLSPRQRFQGDKALSAIKKAFNTLIDPDKRAAYRVELESRRSDTAWPARRAAPDASSELPLSAAQDAVAQLETQEAQVARALGKPRMQADPKEETSHSYAHVFYAQAASAANGEQWRRAYKLVREAANLDANDPHVIALQAWVIFNLPMKDKARQSKVCRQRLQLACGLSPHLTDPHYYLARVEESLGNISDAARSYRRVLDLDESYRDALSRLASLPLTEGSTSRPNSVLDRLKGWLDR